MIQIGQKIDYFIDDFEFEVYQNHEIKKIKFSNYGGKWLVLLFYPADFTFICPTESASFVRQHQGEVCPASWKPGKKTLRPGLDLGGKI